ncbi:hypothetical protein WBJ53_32825 (plasmid) [Spirosoma sp. SC4-14]|uniref:hypothetical protein n=1 Tax=Spirosoma sp. SC4-14 TaxID=3128900 RepID=UPI0030D4D835
MGANKQNVTPENVDVWLASTGFLFPRTEQELMHFEKLFPEEEIDTSNSDVSIERILSGEPRSINAVFNVSKPIGDFSQYRMVARKGEGQIPDHILNKMKQNQENKKKDNGE